MDDRYLTEDLVERLAAELLEQADELAAAGGRLETVHAHDAA